MNRMIRKPLLALLVFITVFSVSNAQSVDDGIKFLYYGKTKSAVDALNKAVAAKPKDAYTIYWLGQAYLRSQKYDSAAAIYQKALADGVNDPWIWIGSAHVDLLKGGDVNAAKQKFDQAITAATATKGKNKGKPDPNILVAVGRAMADGPSTVGDPAYGVDKLKQAIQIDPNNTDAYINLGICYLKQGSTHGGEAYQAFSDATTHSGDPKYAMGDLRIGNIYKSQSNLESMKEWYDKAITADATFAPVYLQYFDYYSERDINQAKGYLDKYIANSDQSCETQYFQGDYLFRSGSYQQAIDKAKQMESGGCASYPRINVLYAYGYDRLGDSVKANEYITKFLTTAPKESIQPSDYALAGQVDAKLPNMNDSAVAYLTKAVALDTVKENQLKYLDTAMAVMSRSKNFKGQMALMQQLAKITGDSTMSESDFFKLSKSVTDALLPDSSSLTTAADTTSSSSDSSGATVSRYKCADSTIWVTADSITKAYATAYPAKPQGYTFRTLAAKRADCDTTHGYAVEAIAFQNDYLKKNLDSGTNRKTAYVNDYYLLVYYAQYAKDAPKEEEYKKAITVLDDMTTLYPDASSDENKFATNTKQQLQSSLDKFERSKNAPAKSSSTTEKPKTTTKPKPKTGTKG